MNYTYIVRCSDDTFYTGWTNHLQRRLKAHNEGHGAKYTKGRRPVTLIYYEVFETREEAMSREYAIKHLTRKQKEALCNGMTLNIHDAPFGIACGDGAAHCPNLPFRGSCSAGEQLPRKQ